jgi:hypothetical protein
LLGLFVDYDGQLNGFRITFKGLKLRYRPELDLVLKGISWYVSLTTLKDVID